MAKKTKQSKKTVEKGEAEITDEANEGDGSGESSNDSDAVGGEEQDTSPAKPSSKRGRPAKDPPPPKLWRLEGESPEGMRVTLGRYVTKEEAEPDLERLQEDGFYGKLNISKSKE